MGQSLRTRLRRLLGAICPTCATTQQAEDEAEDECNANLSIVVVASHRSSTSPATTHWAIAIVTDERSRQCRVFHVSDAHIVGLRALGWTAFAQDETLDRSSRCQGGVRVGLVERDDLRRLEEAICGNQVPPPTSDIWDCEDWTLAVIRHLEDEGFTLATYGLDDGALINHRPVFVSLSLPSAGH
ncbi:hypothetical protein GSI_12418 [Ganoderma sinense ZZ0214-1]|uniref:Uncharacterized protein n=1 Tax=Ganoderma sinense ZZ0214-1 TaxID=1077348 RepID=A0A2G8RVI8_9APHY|nr:hypothetical protein GSI_12418 [Ganoderma sinense ZZ0214-1]